MRLDPVTNKMAMVVLTPEGRAELIRRFHLAVVLPALSCSRDLLDRSRGGSELEYEYRS